MTIVDFYMWFEDKWVRIFEINKLDFDLKELKSKTNKCYTIEIMGNDKVNGNQYGIMLDAKDFELKYPFNEYI